MRRGATDAESILACAEGAQRIIDGKARNAAVPNCPLEVHTIGINSGRIDCRII